MSDYLWPHGWQHARLPCSSLFPRVCTNSCPLSQWCHPTNSSSVASFSSCPQSFPASGALPVMWPKYLSFSFSISPSNEYSGFNSFRIYWFDLLFVKGTLKCLLQYHNSKASILWHSAYFMVQLSHLYPFLVAQMVKSLPAIEEAWVQPPGQEDPSEKGMATHSNILAWRIPCTEEPGGLQPMGLQRVGHDWAINTTATHIHTWLLEKP